MLKVRTSRASKEAENKSGVVEGYLFNGYSKRKLYCLSETYEELARLYRDIPQAEKICADRRDMLYRQQIRETKEVFANHLDEISSADTLFEKTGNRGQGTDFYRRRCAGEL